MRALLITNPAAARTEPLAVSAVMATFEQAGWQAEVLATGKTGDARRLAADGVADGVDVVAVFGGDGTTMQAAASLVGTDVALGVIPGGTGNLLAGNLRIPPQPARAAKVLVTGRRRRFDLGHVQRPTGDSYFAVACGAGYDALVMAATLSEQKRRWGIGAYLATTLKLIGELRSSHHIITIDGVEYESQAATVLVANCGEVIPPLVQLRSGIAPDDGLLDVVAIRADSFGEAVRAVWGLLREGRRSEALIGYGRGREVRVESEPVQPVQLDGEAGGVTPFTARVVPGAISIMVP